MIRFWLKYGFFVFVAVFLVLVFMVSFLIGHHGGLGFGKNAKIEPDYNLCVLLTDARAHTRDMMIYEKGDPIVFLKKFRTGNLELNKVANLLGSGVIPEDSEMDPKLWVGVDVVNYQREIEASGCYFRWVTGKSNYDKFVMMLNKG